MNRQKQNLSQQKYPTRPMAETMQMIREFYKTSDNELEVETCACIVPIIDPISGNRIKMPCRFKKCIHLKVFDYHNFLQNNEGKGDYTTVHCPICKGKDSKKDLAKKLEIDEYFQELLGDNTLDQSVKLVEISRDGVWSVPTSSNSVPTEVMDLETESGTSNTENNLQYMVNNLQSTVSILQKNQQELKKDHQELEKNYQELKKDYQELAKNHQQLEKDHQELKKNHQELQGPEKVTEPGRSNSVSSAHSSMTSDVASCARARPFVSNKLRPTSYMYRKVLLPTRMQQRSGGAVFIPRQLIRGAPQNQRIMTQGRLTASSQMCNGPIQYRVIDTALTSKH